jgi:fatty acid desaturase
MFENITPAGVSAGFAGIIVWGMFLRKFLSLEEGEERKSIILFSLLVAMLISSFLCWLAGATLLLAILPWILCLVALVMFISKEHDQADSMFDGFDDLEWFEDEELLSARTQPALRLVEKNP